MQPKLLTILIYGMYNLYHFGPIYTLLLEVFSFFLSWEIVLDADSVFDYGMCKEMSCAILSHKILFM